MSSKSIKIAALHEQMHNFDLPVCNIIFRRGKKSGIHSRNQTHMNNFFHAPFTCYKCVLKILKAQHFLHKCTTLTCRGGGSSFEVQVKIMFSALKFLWYTQFDFEQEARELKSLICFCTVSLFALFVRKKF